MTNIVLFSGGSALVRITKDLTLSILTSGMINMKRIIRISYYVSSKACNLCNRFYFPTSVDGTEYPMLQLNQHNFP